MVLSIGRDRSGSPVQGREKLFSAISKRRSNIEGPADLKVMKSVLAEFIPYAGNFKIRDQQPQEPVALHRGDGNGS